ncbi:mitotic spindle assembly checkpoint protein MAD2A [Anabrus simplex]|uniref:mitotic spindle assembly checkpoint protein MAD2A n=1 Tax=Anabrus simplex TaxID=316456 RepID=UPI0034DCCBC2
METKQASAQSQNAITLKGSAALVREYLNYGINNILYQRGIYPSEDFTTEQCYGLTILMSTNEKIKAFLKNVLEQIEEWLIKKKIEKITLVINDIKTKETLERWDFKVQYDEGTMNGTEEVGNKELRIIQKEIRDVLRQISATVSYLPLLDTVCVFDVVVQTVLDTEVPHLWDLSSPTFIANAQEVQLRTFSTSLHRMETYVSYKVD